MKTAEIKNFLKYINKGKVGRIVTKFGTNKLYFDFQYEGKRYEKTTGLDFSAENAAEARKQLDEMVEKMLAGTFCFAACFPDANPAVIVRNTLMERRRKAKRPDQMTIRDFIKGTPENDYQDGWEKTNLPSYSEEVQNRYQGDIDYWLIPSLGDLTFAELTGDKLHQWLNQLTVKKCGKKKLSGRRSNNILTPLRRIWQSARSHYGQYSQTGWRNLEDPFKYLEDNGYLPKVANNPTRMLLFREFLAIRKHLDEYHRCVADIMALTGMIASEISGLRKIDVFFDVATPYLHIRNSIVGKKEKKKLKNDFRERQQYITKHLSELLNYFIANSPDEYVFTKADGTRYSHDNFRDAWALAFDKAKIEYVRPYTLRHCFSGWSKIMGVQLSWLQDMMGHGSLEMLYKRYGRHKFGLQDEKEQLIEFFGRDYLRLGTLSPAQNTCESCESTPFESDNSRKKAA